MTVCLLSVGLVQSKEYTVTSAAALAALNLQPDFQGLLHTGA